MAKLAGVHALADRLAPRVRKQFLAAVKTLRDRVTIDALAEAVAAGGVTARLRAEVAAWPKDLRDAAATINEVIAGTVAAEERAVLDRLRIDARFDVVNQRAVDAAVTQTEVMVRGVTEQTQQAIQAVIQRSIRDGIVTRDAAVQIRPLIGLTERQAMAVINYRFTLLAEGMSPAKVHEAAGRYAERLLRQRADMIARTETIRAGRLGRHETWRQAREAGYLPPDARARWVVTPDDRLCLLCAPMAGEEVPLGVDFDTPRGRMPGPPLHPQCRCTTVLVTPRRSRAAA